MVYMYHSFLIHSSADGHLGCFHVLAMINSAVMNIGVHVSLSKVPRSGTFEMCQNSISSCKTLHCYPERTGGFSFGSLGLVWLLSTHVVLCTDTEWRFVH